MEDHRKAAYGHAFLRIVHGAITSLATARIADKRPSTTLKVNADEWFFVVFKPTIQSLPTGWTVGNPIRAELRARGEFGGVPGNGCEIIAKLLPDGTIQPRRWRADVERTVAGFERLTDLLSMMATTPERAVSANNRNCSVCGRGLTDADSKARGIGPECTKLFNHLLDYIHGEHEVA